MEDRARLWEAFDCFQRTGSVDAENINSAFSGIGTLPRTFSRIISRPRGRRTSWRARCVTCASERARARSVACPVYSMWARLQIDRLTSKAPRQPLTLFSFRRRTVYTAWVRVAVAVEKNPFPVSQPFSGGHSYCYRLWSSCVWTKIEI